MSQSVSFARLAIDAIEPFTLFIPLKTLYIHMLFDIAIWQLSPFFLKCFSHHNNLRRCMNTSHDIYALFALMPSIYMLRYDHANTTWGSPSYKQWGVYFFLLALLLHMTMRIAINVPTIQRTSLWSRSGFRAQSSMKLKCLAQFTMAARCLV